MVNALIIFYEGTKPTKGNVEALANGLLTTSWCDGVTEIKHFDSDSISRAILDRSSKQEKKHCTISISAIDDVKRTQAAHRLESILNITFAQALAMLEEGKISVPIDIDIDDITNGPSEYAISQAVYVMNSYSGRLWDLIHIIEKVRDGVHTREVDAVRNAIEILHSKAAYERLIKMDPNIRSIIALM